jgi:CIC family chloride channel protein
MVADSTVTAAFVARLGVRVRGRFARAMLRVAPTEAQRLLAVTVVIGVVCGLAAVAFHEAIRISEGFVTARIQGVTGRGWIPWMLAAPALGGVVAGLLLTYVFPNARGSGIPQVKASYARKAGRVRLRDAIGKFFLSTIQIGSGASLGREGPTVQICAGVASALGRLARISPEAQRKLIPVGAAAGIAAAFNAPIAAVTFTIEEIIGKLDDTVLSGVIIAAALSAVIERSILGEHPVFDVPGHYGLDDARSLVLYALLGVAAAGASIAFYDLLLHLRLRFRRLKSPPEWARPAIGGLVTGALAVVVLLGTGTTGVMGGGYDTLRRALSGDLSVRVMVVLCVAKLLATCFSYSSGGSGGIFAPVLFIGAMLGGAFGWIDVEIFHHPTHTMGAFALVGMGALFSGAVRAPMTSVLIIVEMTSGYDLILPLMIANMTAYLLARRYRRPTIYEALLAQDDINVEDRHLVDALERFALADLIIRDAGFVTLDRSDNGPAILRLVAGATSRQCIFQVLDADRRVIGLLSNEELRLLASEPELLPLVNAADMMRMPVTIASAASLREAFETMEEEALSEIPVVDERGRIIGFIDEGSLAHAYVGAPAAKNA